MIHIKLDPPWNGSVIGVPREYFIRLCLVKRVEFAGLTLVQGKVIYYLSLN